MTKVWANVGLAEKAVENVAHIATEKWPRKLKGLYCDPCTEPSLCVRHDIGKQWTRQKLLSSAPYYTRYKNYAVKSETSVQSDQICHPLI